MNSDSQPAPDPDAPAPASGPRYWRSLDELAEEPGFREQLEREFGPGASELAEVDRRQFFKVMAASFALGGVGFAGCRRPEQKILPYSKSPEQVVPGEPLYYATSFSLRGEAFPLLVETHTGRPTKIEANPDFPSSRGTALKTQASVLDLYDPDRATRHQKGESTLSKANVEDLLRDLRRQCAETGGEGVAILAESSASPTRARLKRAFAEAYPEALWIEYDAVSAAAPAKAAAAVVESGVEPRYDFSKAARILSLGGDFLGEEPGSLSFNKQFADGRRVRKPGDPMNRLYVAESGFTVTGAAADHRLRSPAGRLVSLLAAFALELELGIEGASLRPHLQRLAGVLDDDARAWARRCAQDLAAHRGASLVYAGSQLPVEVQALALLVNEKLGNLRKTVLLPRAGYQESAGIETLAEALQAGSVDTLLVLGGNPAYNAPADLDFPSLMEKAGSRIRLGYHFDETSAKADVHLLQTHYLEAWGDGRAYDGSWLAQQPMIQPLFDGLSEIEVLARLLGESDPDGYSLVYATFQQARGAPGKRAFDKFLHDGLLPGSGFPASRKNVSGPKVTALLEKAQPAPAPGPDALEVVFACDPKMDDGRFNNNGWLMECPDPMTKLTWDNAILVSPRLAKELDIMAGPSGVVRRNPNKVRDGREFSPVAKIKLGGREIKGPVHIHPGLANYTLVLPLGYGRSVTGRIGENAGFNAFALRPAGSPAFAAGASLELTGETYQLANTQEHWSMEGRAIVREANLETYEKKPDWVAAMGMESHSPPIYGKEGAKLSTQEKITQTPRGASIYEHPDYEAAHQWGMNIDLNVCTGCNACVVACQSENNIPIVGRDQVRRGREMHWIRLDRYFSSGLEKSEVPEDPQATLQPVTCMHCETAPCETVCPVNATVHDEEGLNLMAYNRCIGTRYCANNCPYKVRRFNFFDYQQRQRDKLYLGPLAPKGMPELLQMAQNPDVSVRSRGVMEKCTFCVQRIQQAKIDRKVEARDSGDLKIPDGTIQTACEQACPSEAIVFGDLSDPESRVSRLRENDRNYAVLGYLNTRPRTTYLGKLRNPNPKMPDYFEQPLSKVEYKQKAYGDKDSGHHAPAGASAHSHDEGGAH